MAKVLAVGAGSMGRRRLRDLLALKAGEVILYEPQAARCGEVAEKFGVRGFTDFEVAMAEQPDIMTVSTPPTLHESYVQRAMERNLHVFVEVPFVFDLKFMEEIAAKASGYPSVLGISHTIRYYPPFALIHALIHSRSIGNPLHVEYSLGYYLPDWHPYEDYRTFYGSDAAMGGGGLDMVFHELSPLQWWLGNIKSVFARFSKLSKLDIKGSDSQDILLRFENGATGFFHDDVIEQGAAGRHVRIVGDLGTIEWHQNLQEVRYFDGASGQVNHFPFSEAPDWKESLHASQEMSEILRGVSASSGRTPGSEQKNIYNYESAYLREMRSFLNAVHRKSSFSMTDAAEELQNIRTFHAIVKSAELSREINVAEMSA